MSSRRERPPSGRVARPQTALPVNSNVNSRPQTANPLNSNRNQETQQKNKNYNNDTFEFSNNQHRDAEFDFTKEKPMSHRSQYSELSTNEILRRMREKNNIEKNKQESAEIHALGSYNAFSRPRCSSALPLRTVFLDPDANNFPPSRTRSELMKKIKLSGTPHPSYDLDMDGYVSQKDYRLAKRFDFDGNGVLDPSERHVGKKILSEEFFKRHANDLYNYGPNFVKNTHSKNVENLVNSYSFERAYDKLMTIERNLEATSSKPILNCIRPDPKREHAYFSNKFDTTAWNDFDGIPRTETQKDIYDHGGSSKRLFFCRKERLRNEIALKMEKLTFKTSMPIHNTRRVNMITDPAIENS